MITKSTSIAKNLLQLMFIMDEVFLEVAPARFTAADFARNHLSMSFCRFNNGFQLIFYTEDDYCKYLSELETESSNLLSQYWEVKTQDLIERNRFIIAVITTLTVAKSKKYSC